ncbi:unannotated protein [freshwater metagenome]|uniref:Unannotated protein n=1 Tax=freshwater metagenome TaxID=449393 RepID=A0A6J7PW87_9ZZZZ
MAVAPATVEAAAVEPDVVPTDVVPTDVEALASLASDDGAQDAVVVQELGETVGEG